MRAEDFFPLGWLEKPFRRQPYPDMTYGEAILAASALAWNIDTDDARAVHEKLTQIHLRMTVDHAQYEGRSMQNVAELGTFWRGKVTTLLKWFQTKNLGVKVSPAPQGRVGTPETWKGGTT